MMNDTLILKSWEHKSGQKGKAVILNFSCALPEDFPRDWIHVSSMNRVRLKAQKGRDEDLSTARIKGLGKDALRRGDRFIPLNSPRVVSQRFYGFLDSRPRLPVSGEFSVHKQKIHFRVSSAHDKGAGIVLLDLGRSVDLAIGSAVDLGPVMFTPLSVNCYRKISRETTPFKAQGWLPQAGFSGPGGTLKSSETSGDFLFFLPWLEWARSILQGPARKEGGLETAQLGSLLGLPSYLLPDLLTLFARKKWFLASKGILLDASWDYSSSLSPMSRGILDELRESGFLLDKIAGAPRHRSLELLVRTRLAVEVEEGLFVEFAYLKKVYGEVLSLRKEDPDIGLSELARRTGLKKRFLISVLQYGDSQE